MKLGQNIRINGQLGGFLKSAVDGQYVETFPFKSAAGDDGEYTWPATPVRLMEVTLCESKNTLPFDVQVTMFGRTFVLGRGERTTNMALVSPPTPYEWSVDVEKVRRGMLDPAPIVRCIHGGNSTITLEELMAPLEMDGEQCVPRGHDGDAGVVMSTGYKHIDIFYRVVAFQTQELSITAREGALMRRTETAWYVESEVLPDAMSFIKEAQESVPIHNLQEVTIRLQRADLQKLAHKLPDIAFTSGPFLFQLNLQMTYFSL
jgi:hypothetical protein